MNKEKVKLYSNKVAEIVLNNDEEFNQKQLIAQQKLKQIREDK